MNTRDIRRMNCLNKVSLLTKRYICHSVQDNNLCSFPETYNDSKYSDELNVVISIIGREMLHDKNKEIDGLNKEFQRQIQVLVEDHKKEVDVSIRCVVFKDNISGIYFTLAKFLPLTQFQFV